MTLLELSAQYASGAQAIRLRIGELRAAIRTEESPEQVWALRRRIAVLEPLLREARELAALTAHYYDKRGMRHE